jgi:hypothetical protein
VMARIKGRRPGQGAKRKGGRKATVPVSAPSVIDPHGLYTQRLASRVCRVDPQKVRAACRSGELACGLNGKRHVIFGADLAAWFRGLTLKQKEAAGA